MASVEEGWNANPARYDNATYNRSGKSGLMLPQITLGLWQNLVVLTFLKRSVP